MDKIKVRLDNSQNKISKLEYGLTKTIQSNRERRVNKNSGTPVSVEQYPLAEYMCI